METGSSVRGTSNKNKCDTTMIELPPFKLCSTQGNVTKWATQESESDVLPAPKKQWCAVFKRAQSECVVPHTPPEVEMLTAKQKMKSRPVDESEKIQRERVAIAEKLTELEQRAQ